MPRIEHFSFKPCLQKLHHCTTRSVCNKCYQNIKMSITSTVGAMGRIPGLGTKIPHALWRSQKRGAGERDKNKIRKIPKSKKIHKTIHF